MHVNTDCGFFIATASSHSSKTYRWADDAFSVHSVFLFCFLADSLYRISYNVGLQTHTHAENVINIYDDLCGVRKGLAHNVTAAVVAAVANSRKASRLNVAKYP